MLSISACNFWVKKLQRFFHCLDLTSSTASLGMQTKSYIIHLAVNFLALSCLGEDAEGLCICLLHLIAFHYLLLTTNWSLRYSKFHRQTIA